MARTNSYYQQQTVELPISTSYRQGYSYRFTFARSSESQATGDPGQDFLAYREEGSRLAVVLCDGVSQSFYGDLAARFLGKRLLDWLWELEPGDEEALRVQLLNFLAGLVPEAAREVATVQLPASLPQMLVQVLEEKRAMGSETMFTAALFDRTYGRVVLASLGDMRTRVWSATGREITVSLGEKTDSSQRWSTLMGPKGQPHVKILDLRSISSLVLYSDGLASMDDSSVNTISNAILSRAIQQTFLDPKSDDVSFFEIRTGAKTLLFDTEASEPVPPPITEPQPPVPTTKEPISALEPSPTGILPGSDREPISGQKPASVSIPAPVPSRPTPMIWIILTVILFCLACAVMALMQNWDGIVGGQEPTPSRTVTDRQPFPPSPPTGTRTPATIDTVTRIPNRSITSLPGYPVPGEPDSPMGPKRKPLNRSPYIPYAPVTSSTPTPHHPPVH